MTRLFLRFFFGVLLILFGAWCIQIYAFYLWDPFGNLRHMENWFGGGVRLACKELADTPPQDRPDVLTELQRRFGYPVEITRLDRLSKVERTRLMAGDDVIATWQQNGLCLVGPLPESGEVFQLGPVSLDFGPGRSVMMVGLGCVLLLTAIAIAFLLRPVARQLRLVERTAIEIADGNLSIVLTNEK